MFFKHFFNTSLVFLKIPGCLYNSTRHSARFFISLRTLRWKKIRLFCFQRLVEHIKYDSDFSFCQIACDSMQMVDFDREYSPRWES